MRHILVLFALVLCLSSCNTMSMGDDEVNNKELQNGILTGDATHISCRNVVLSGKIDKVVAEGSAPVEAGILYSLSSGVIMGGASKHIATAFDSDYRFAVTLDAVLAPESTYYYRAYVSGPNGVSYGEVKSFKTLSVSSLIRTEIVTDLKQNSAILNATLNLKDCVFSTLEYGFSFGVEENGLVQKQAENLSGDKFSTSLGQLTIETEYRYSAYVILDGETYEGEIKQFTTPGIKAEVETGEVSALDCSAAILHGHISITDDVTLEGAKFGFLWTTDVACLDVLKSANNKVSEQLGEDGSFQKEVLDLKANTTYYYLACAELQQRSFFGDVKTFTTTEYVDLGLSVKWRNRNLGAITPQLNGDYYAWGETETKPIAQYTWNYYKWCDGSYTALTKYNSNSNNGIVDNKTELDENDDVAHVKLGGNWRMPTKQEVSELVTGCEWTLSQQPDGLGSSARGYVGTSKKNGRRIFIPVSLYVSNGKGQGEEFSYGCFWSKSVGSGSGAYGFNGVENNSVRPKVQVSSNTLFGRSHGLPIRPVTQ